MTDKRIIKEYEALSDVGKWLADRRKPGDTWYSDKAKEIKKGVSDYLNKPVGADTADYAAAKADSSGEPTSSVFSRMKQKAPAPVGKEPAAPASSSAPAAEKPPASSGDKPVSVKHTKGGDYNIYAKGSEKAADFRKAYAAAKGNFEWEGRKYAKPSSEKATTTPTAKPAASSSVPTPPKRPDDLGKVNAPLPPSRPSDLPKPAGAGLSQRTLGFDTGAWNPSKDWNSRISADAPGADEIKNSKWRHAPGDNFKAEKPQSFSDVRLSPSATSGNAEFPMSDKFVRTEPKKKVNEMSEETNPLIAAFLKLQDENPSNMFEAAKKLSKKQDEKLDVVDDDKIDAKDFAALRAGKKHVEENSLPTMAKPSANANVRQVTTDFSAPDRPAITKTKPAEDPSLPKTYPGAASTVKGPNPTSDLFKNRIAKEEVELDEISKSKAGKAIMGRAAKGVDAEEKGDYDASEKHFNKFSKSKELFTKKFGQKSGDKMTDAVGMRFNAEEVHTNPNPQTKKPYTAPETSVKQPKWKINKKDQYKMNEEEVEQIDEIGDTKAGQKALKSYVKKADRSSEKSGDVLFNPSNPTYRAAEKGKPGAEEKYSAASLSYHNRLKGMDAAKKRIKEENEEVEFSQEEIDFINSFFLEASVAPNRPEVATGADSTSDKMSQNDVTVTAESGKSYFDDKKVKKVKEEVELEEGRPRKNPTPETTERDPRKHIQVEAGRAAAGSVVDFHHNDGSKSKITPAMGRKITSHLQSLKPADRQAAVNKMHDSAEGLKV